MQECFTELLGVELGLAGLVRSSGESGGVTQHGFLHHSLSLPLVWWEDTLASFFGLELQFLLVLHWWSLT